MKLKKIMPVVTLSQFLFLFFLLTSPAKAQFYCSAHFSELPPLLVSKIVTQPWINTSNLGKQLDFQIMGRLYGFDFNFSQANIKEPLGTPYEVITYKASKFLESEVPVIVEDQSLEIAGSDVGVELKRFLKEGKMDRFEGLRATWRSLFAVAWDHRVYIFEASVPGTMIGHPLGDGPGFHNYFVPDQTSHSLGEKLETFELGTLPLKRIDARHLALEKILKGRVQSIEHPLTDWNGPFQEE